MKQPGFALGVRLAADAVVCGDVTIGENSSIWFHTTIRAEVPPITIGAQTNIQDNCVLHVDTDFPLTVGDRVTVGHGVILHGCTVGDRALIGMGSIIMNGAVIGADCIIGAGTLVTQNTVIPEGSMAFGNPVQVRRVLTEEERRGNLHSAQYYLEESQTYVEAGLFRQAEETRN